MISEIKIGPPVITINQGSTFMVTTESGEIVPERELGVFAQDTRLISRYRFFIQGKPWLLSTSATINHYSARLYLVSPAMAIQNGTLGEQELGLTIHRTIGNGVHDDFDITNYCDHEIVCHFAIEIGSDFADLFDVKLHDTVERGHFDSVWDAKERALFTRYENRDFHRGVTYQLLRTDSQPHYGNGTVFFEIRLKPGETWHTCAYIIPVIGKKELTPLYDCYQVHAGHTEMDRLQKKWQESTTAISTPCSLLENAFRRSVSDMGALRLYEQDVNEDVWLPAAGVPWFVTIFGRDSLVVSLQNMMVNCGFALGTLKVLAEFQAKERDDYRDAQPGKILHEIRFGELAHFKLVPHTPYYGTADATILFLIVLCEAFLWMGEEKLLRQFRDTALRCLEWIDRFGDLDGDGFQEYKTFSSKGYHNMGWKDAEDAVVYPNGTQVEQPIGICELQGYVYDAKLRMADVFEYLGEHASSQQLRSEAARLKQRFNQVFWLEKEGFYAYALDPEKQPVATVASNPGHLLWSGIVDSKEKASRVIQRLLQPDMFSGWGVRTLSSRNPAYNPHAYQRGSVWPHDNGFIAAGAKRYGLWREANHIARAILDAAGSFQSCRLPELFAGFDRQESSFPVQYIGANVPQAWAAGSVFALLQSILGIQANAPEDTLYVNPTLPEWLPEITITNLLIGKNRIAIRFSGTGEDSSYEVINNPGNVRINTTLPRAA